MIEQVVIYNKETREGHENEGKVQKVELTGRQFSHLLRSSYGFPEFFSYVNSFTEWVDAEEK